MPNKNRNAPVPIRIHQFHSGSAYGDAVTNSMLLMQEHLRALGFESEVFVEHLDPKLSGLLRPYLELKDRIGPDDLLLLQHSMGHDRLDWILGLPCRKALVYHNITPAEFFPEGSAFHHYSRLGRSQLQQIRPLVEHAFAVSEYNARELLELGFEQVDVLPVLVQDQKFDSALAPRCLEKGTGRPWTVLFVGRVCENKGHEKLVAVAEAWLRKYPAFPIQFTCVGSFDRDSPYFDQVNRRIQAAGLSADVSFVGKISDDELIDWYTRADCYLSLSSHEGFGVPLIEAMFCDLPVVALEAAAVAETMGGAGVLLSSTDPEEVSSVLFRLMRSRPYRHAIVAGQRRRASAFRSRSIRARLTQALATLGLECPCPASQPAPDDVNYTGVRIEGPCDSSYSLAIVNRELALALDRVGARTAMFCTEGPGDYVPAPETLALLPERARTLIETGKDSSRPGLCVRNLYPPRVRDARGDLNTGYFFWEESSFPAAYVCDFNLSLDFLLAPSRFVADVWRSSGVGVPIHYVGAGADHVEEHAAEPLPDGVSIPGGLRFLHVSSCFPRKGPDVLLRAWGRAFAGRSDVHLVIKTFANPHNEVPGLLEQLRDSQPDYPPVTLLMGDYSPGQLRTLYESSHAYVAPSRGEGFGLPMAEAMLHGIPVIATGWGGHADFCTETTSYPIRYHLNPSSSHVAEEGTSLWAEPDEDHLVELLRAVADGSDEAMPGKVERARQLIRSEYTWDAVAARVLAAEMSVRGAAGRDFQDEPLRLGWASTWNEQCGIATYSGYLLEHLPAGEFDLKVYGRAGSSKQDGNVALANHWRDASEPSMSQLVEAMLADEIEVAVFQFNFGFFNVRALGEAIRMLEQNGVKVVVALHSTRDVDKPDFKASLRDAEGLGDATRILVHSLEDLNRLVDMGLGQRAVLFPHGAMDGPTLDKSCTRHRLRIQDDVKIIASYGFMLPHKGLPELVEAFVQVLKKHPDAYLFMVNSLFPDGVSHALLEQLSSMLINSGIRDRVRLFTDFLPEDTSIALLQAADVIVFPYQETAESASGAVRFGLAAHRPVACTPLGIFSDLEGHGVRFGGCSPRAMAEDLVRWLSEADIDGVVAGQDRWLRARAWPKLMVRLADMFRGLVLDSGSNH